MKLPAILTVVMLSVTIVASTSGRSPLSGTVYYTKFSGGQNVNSVTYSYNDSTNALTLGSQTNVASALGRTEFCFDNGQFARWRSRLAKGVYMSTLRLAPL